MAALLGLLLFIVGYFLLMKYLLPRLGVPT
jgi:hypothetical protein